MGNASPLGLPTLMGLLCEIGLDAHAARSQILGLPRFRLVFVQQGLAWTGFHQARAGNCFVTCTPIGTFEGSIACALP